MYVSIGKFSASYTHFDYAYLEYLRFYIIASLDDKMRRFLKHLLATDGHQFNEQFHGVFIDAHIKIMILMIMSTICSLF
jgi:hypothetical protein